MPHLSTTTELHIKDFLSEKKTEILSVIEKERRVLIQADPAAGKTHFFKELANDITTGKRTGRLVFTAPYLIILEQFINDPAIKELTVDLELKGTSKRKNLEKSDKIITSTYQSLHHIIDKLTEDDILIVDEAHALFFNYQQASENRQFYTRTVQNLYHTKSMLVLMSGTPNLSLLPILRLHHVIVHKQNNLQARIAIEYSDSNRFEVVKEFAEKALNENGPSSLNIIYRKSVNDCIKIGQMLNDKGYVTEVITSLHKDTDTYKSIKETEIIPDHIKFLVTTNVISTGTNIKNANVGSALMLDEYSPQEIKQFSKRFRNKLDLKVDVVNRGYVKGVVTHGPALIRNQRTYLSNALLKFETLKDLPHADYDYDPSYDKTYLGSPNSFIDQILERYLKQESYYTDDAENSYESPNDIALELNKYNDIEAQVIFDYGTLKKLKFHLGVDTSNAEVDIDFKAKVAKLITAFEKEPEAYLSAMVNEKFMDYYSKNRIRRLVADELTQQTTYSSDVVLNLKDVLFNKYILMPFLEYRKYFRSTRDFIKLLKSKKNKNLLITSLIVNEVMNDNYDVGSCPTYDEPTLSNLTHHLMFKNNRSQYFKSYQLPIILKLIELTFDYCYDQENIIVENLKNYLENDHGLKKLLINSNDLSEFPLTTISVNKGFVSIKPSTVKGIVQGIFYTNKVLVRKSINGVPVWTIKLKNKLPAGFNTRELNVSSTMFVLSPRIKRGEIKKGKKPVFLKTNENFNYMTTYELLIKEQF